MKSPTHLIRTTVSLKCLTLAAAIAVLAAPPVNRTSDWERRTHSRVRSNSNQRMKRCAGYDA
jgi:hypothetical protein